MARGRFSGCGRHACGTCSRLETLVATPQSSWTGTLATLRRLLGPRVALHLACEFGGVDGLVIPKAPNAHHIWRKVLGDRQWVRVVAALGGCRLGYLARGHRLRLRKLDILTLDATTQMSRRKIAQIAQVSERYVRAVLGPRVLSASEAARDAA